MVYLLKSGPFLKIGYTHTILDKRLSQIRNASPYEVEVLAARPGTLDDEKTLHEGAEPWRHEFGGRSWYNDCPALRAYVTDFFFPGDPKGTLEDGRPVGPPESVTGMFSE